MASVIINTSKYLTCTNLAPILHRFPHHVLLSGTIPSDANNTATSFDLTFRVHADAIWGTVEGCFSVWGLRDCAECQQGGITRFRRLGSGCVRGHPVDGVLSHAA